MIDKYGTGSTDIFGNSGHSITNLYLSPSEKNPVKQNAITRQLIENLATTNSVLVQSLTFSKSGSNPNEFAHAILAFAVTTTTTLGYEKGGIFSDIRTSDLSTAAFHKDIVGADLRGTITAGTTQGRAWGIYSQSRVESGADGYAIGMEIQVKNNGSDQPTIDSQYQKVNLHIGASGLIDNTAGIIFINDGAKFHNAIYGSGTCISTDGYFINYDNGFLVKGDIGTAGSPLVIKNNGNYNLVSLNGDTIFPSAIGIAGGHSTDTALYVYSQDNIYFYYANIPLVTFGSDKTIAVATLVTTNLPSSPAIGTRAFVTDASAATFGSSFAGGGIAQVPVFYGVTLTSTTPKWRVG